MGYEDEIDEFDEDDEKEYREFFPPEKRRFTFTEMKEKYRKRNPRNGK